MTSNAAPRKILVLHGPNLNLLGLREPDIYGHTTLADINAQLTKISLEANVVLECFQSNFEGELINKTAATLTNGYDFLLINPAGLTHTSIAWRDTLLAINKPFIEIHLSNIYKREEFRHKSYFSDIAVGLISGLGAKGYELALEYAIATLNLDN